MTAENHDVPPTLSRSEFYQKTLPAVATRFPGFPLEIGQMFFSLVFAYEAVSSHMGRRLGRFGLTFPSFNVLMILNSPTYRESGCPMSQIGELLLVSKANITGVVDNLEKRGLVARLDASYDRRVKLAKVTPAGMDLVLNILPGHLREMRRITGKMSKADRVQIRDLLAKLQKSVLSAGEEPQDETA